MRVYKCSFARPTQNATQGTLILRKWSKGGIPPVFRPFGRIGETRARKAFPRAPTCVKCNSEALERRPQPMPSINIVCFFFGYVLGLSGTAALEGAKGFPLLTTRGGGISPQKSTKIIYSPRLTTICPQLTDNIPLFDHYDSLKSDYKMTSPRPRPKARIDHGQNIQKSRTVAIVCVRRNLGTTTRTYQIFIDEVKIYILFLENMMR